MYCQWIYPCQLLCVPLMQPAAIKQKRGKDDALPHASAMHEGKGASQEVKQEQDQQQPGRDQASAGKEEDAEELGPVCASMQVIGIWEACTRHHCRAHEWALRRSDEWALQTCVMATVHAWSSTEQCMHMPQGTAPIWVP